MKSDAIKLLFVLCLTQIDHQRLSYKLYLKAQKGFKTMGHEWHLARLCSPYTSTPVAQWLAQRAFK